MIRGPFDYDAAKNAANRDKHGVGLEDFRGFDAEVAILPDKRRDYGEERFSAFGLIDGIPYNLVFTPRGDHLRLISFRRAHLEELERYEG